MTTTQRPCSWRDVLLRSSDQRGRRSPFSRLIALDYNDGPTEGVAWSDACSDAATFEMIAADRGQAVRIFALRPLPAASFDRAVRACSPTGGPDWPSWVPIWRFDSEALRLEAERALDAALADAGAVSLVVATRDLLGTILAAKPVTETELAEATDWFARLNLSVLA